MKTKKFFVFTLIAAFAGLVLTASAIMSTTTEVVTGNTSSFENDPGWYFARDLGNAVAYNFTTDEQSIGSGSLYVPPLSNVPAHKFIGEYFEIIPMGDFQSFSYDFMMADSGSATRYKQYYLNVYANFEESDDYNFYDCRYELLPVSGSSTSFTTVTFDASQPYSVTTRNTSPHPCPAVPADMGAGANIRAFAINLGDTSANDAGLDGYFDNVVLSRTSGTTIFDFEADSDGDGVGDSGDNCPNTPNPGQEDFDNDGVGDACDSVQGPPTSTDQCKNGNWAFWTRPNGSSFKNQGDCIQYVNTGK